jgi:hypothetical protein
LACIGDSSIAAALPTAHSRSRHSYHCQGDEAMQRTVVTDIDIPFGRLIMIFIKFGLAAIPAAIIISIVVSLIAFALSAVFGVGFMAMGPGHSI